MTEDGQSGFQCLTQGHIDIACALTPDPNLGSQGTADEFLNLFKHHVVGEHLLDVIASSMAMFHYERLGYSLL